MSPDWTDLSSMLRMDRVPEAAWGEELQCLILTEPCSDPSA
jgi:hypothetical protein